MSNGDLSPGTAPTSPAPSSSPSSAPTSSPPSSPAPASSPRAAQPQPGETPPRRLPVRPNPRAGRQTEHWSDKGNPEAQYAAAERARAAAEWGDEQPPSPADAGRDSAPGTTPAEQPPEVGPISRGEDGRYKFGEVALSEQEIRDLLQHKAAADSRRATAPSSPDGYKFELPADFQVPQGVELQLNENDPLLPHARALAFAIDRGEISGQQALAKMIGMRAADAVGQIQQFDRQVQAEVQKLGASGTPRINAIQTFLKAIVPEDTLRDLYAGLISEKAVRGWEALMRRFESQGAGSFSHAHREAPESNGSIANYENMSFEQRLAAQEAAKRTTRR